MVSANENREITINAAFTAPVVPFSGVAGCEVDLLKNNSDKLSFGLGINFDAIYDGWFGSILQIKPEIVHTLKNPNLLSDYFFIHSGLGFSYTHLILGNISELEKIDGFGFHLDFIPSYKVGEMFSIGIGLWNSIIFHSKSRLKNRNKTFLSKIGIKLGFDFIKKVKKK